MKKTSHILMLTLFAVVGLFFLMTGEPIIATGVGSLAMAGFAVGDKGLSQSKALPDGAAAITSGSIDLGHGTTGGNLADHEFLVEAPILTTTELPDTKTMVYAVVTSASADLSTPTVVNASLLVQTGAAAAGAAAAEARFRLPVGCQRYVGVKATNDGAGDATGKSVTLSLKF